MLHCSFEGGGRDPWEEPSKPPTSLVSPVQEGPDEPNTSASPSGTAIRFAVNGEAVAPPPDHGEAERTCTPARHRSAYSDMVENRWHQVTASFETPAEAPHHLRRTSKASRWNAKPRIRDMMPSYASNHLNGFWVFPTAMRTLSTGRGNAFQVRALSGNLQGQRVAGDRPRIQEYPVLRRPRHRQRMRHL